jgi:phosphoserine aminotransferase
MEDITMGRIHNFGAGPAAIPEPVLAEAKEQLLDYKGTGMSIMETSHRAPAFDEIIKSAESGFRSLLGISDDYSVLFLQGGASMQFCMLPMNVLNGGTANYIDTGTWSTKALKEAKLFGNVNVAFSGKEEGYMRLPKADELKLDDSAVYTHITSNNTIAGTQFAEFPKSAAPLVSDMSSDILSRPVNVNDFAMIYAGAQKNIGPSGLAVVIIRKDFAEKVEEDKVPTMLKYTTHIEKDSLFNTPPTFPIYLVDLTCKWLQKNGGLEGMEKINTEKADKLYNTINEFSDFYRCPVDAASRSKMNVVFRLPSEDLEKKFVKESTENGMAGLKGHRSVGGIRASIYNATGIEAINDLTAFMKDFAQKNG